MTKVSTNWQAWVLAIFTGAAAIEWYITDRNYSGRFFSILMFLFAASCAISCALYIGRGIGNKTLNENVWLSGIAAFGTAVTAIYGAWEFLIDIGGNSSDFDHAAIWGVGTAVTMVLGYTEIRQAGRIVSQLAGQASNKVEI